MAWEGDNVLRLTMHGAPQGWARAGHKIVGRPPRQFVQIFTPTPMRKYQNSVKSIAMTAMGDRPPLTGPLSVSMRFRMPVPASAPKYMKARMLAGEVAPITRPDVDNMAKAILDAIAERPPKLVELVERAEPLVFLNDWQVTRLFVTKVYAERAGVDVRIEAFMPQGQDAADDQQDGQLLE